MEPWDALPPPKGMMYTPQMREALHGVLVELAGTKATKTLASDLAWMGTDEGAKVRDVCLDVTGYGMVPTGPFIRDRWRAMFPPEEEARQNSTCQLPDCRRPGCIRCEFCGHPEFGQTVGFVTTRADELGITHAVPCRHRGVDPAAGFRANYSTTLGHHYSQERNSAEERMEAAGKFHFLTLLRGE
jgi:hypothetical protein